ncbi:MAG: porin [Candidatus Omnitrophota bacterium]
MRRISIFIIGFAFIFSCAPKGFAATDEEIQALKVQVGELMQRIDKLEIEQVQSKAEVVKAKEQPKAPESLEGRVVKLEEDIKKVPKIANFLKGDMKIGGYVQPRYTAGVDKKINDAFSISNTKLAVSGHVVPEVAYKLEIGPHQSPGTSILYDAFLKLEYFPKVKITMGQFKAPFSEEFITSSSDIKTAARALFQGTLSHEYATGAMIDGDILDTLYYAIAVTNGTDRSIAENNEAKDSYGRLVYSPFKKSENALLKGLRLGTAVQYGRQPRSGNNEGDRLRNLGMLKHTYKGWTFQSEYAHQSQEQIPGAAESSINGKGWYSLLAYKFPLKVFKYDTELEPVVKVEQYNPDTSLDKNRRDMYTAGLTWYLNKYVYVMANYQFRDEQNENSDNRFILQSQVKF